MPILQETEEVPSETAETNEIMPEWVTQSRSPELSEHFCRFVARQPILDRSRRTFGYELLFRSGWENRFYANGDMASRHIVDNAVSFGMESLVGDGVPFVNCTQDLLVSGLPTLLPRYTVLEVLEDVCPDAELIASCKHLHALGYKLALDDYDFSDRWTPLLPFTQFIKVDFRCTEARQRIDLLHKLRFSGIQFVAEKVEDEAELRMAMDEGFHLFQGYFFTRPVVLARPALTTVINRLRFLAELSQPGFHLNRVLGLLKEEPSISYRLLRLANSAAVGAREQLTSLRTAMTMIGEEQFRKLALTALTSELCGGQATETLRFILQKARFCELMATQLGLEPTELYLFGMLSVVQATLKLSPVEVEQTLKLRPEMIAALAGKDNAFRRVLELAHSYEQGDWPAFGELAARVGGTEEHISECGSRARQWAEQVVRAA